MQWTERRADPGLLLKGAASLCWGRRGNSGGCDAADHIGVRSGERMLLSLHPRAHSETPAHPMVRVLLTPRMLRYGQVLRHTQEFVS